jgi:predicted CoA-binding protein
VSPEEAIEDFLAQTSFALYGMSRGGGKFGNRVYANLTSKGYRILPVHPVAEEIGGVRCWPGLDDLPEKVDGAILVIPPPQTEKVVRQIHAARIGRVWMQPGAESTEAVRYCEENGISVVFQECVMVRSSPRPD